MAEPGAPTAPASPVDAAPSARRRDVVLSAIFLVGWLVPLFLAGWRRAELPYLPPFLTNLHRCSCLFTDRVDRWSSWYWLVRLEEDGGYLAVDDADYSRLEPFGHHSRLDLMLAKAGAPPLGNRQRTAIAEFVRRRYAGLHPDDPPVLEVAFVRVVYESGDPELARPGGRWRKQPFAETDPGRRFVVARHLFDPPAADGEGPTP